MFEWKGSKDSASWSCSSAASLPTKTDVYEEEGESPTTQSSAMTFRKVKGNFERLFDKNLTDLVRGIRNNRENEAKYIAQCMEEIKEELRQDNLSVKANAVAKLTYVSIFCVPMVL